MNVRFSLHICIAQQKIRTKSSYRVIRGIGFRSDFLWAHDMRTCFIYMNDDQLISCVFDYLQEKNGCDDIQKMLREQHGIEIDSDHRTRLIRMLVATGLVEKYSFAHGPHSHISLNDEGMRMMMEHSSYLNFLNSRKSNAIKQDKDSKLKTKETKIRIIHIIITIIIAILTFLITVYSLFQNSRIKELEDLLRKNNIEIPK